MISKPDHLLTRSPDHQTLKSLVQVLLERRATLHFAPDPVPEDTLETLLELATQAPSGYNLQPWRFIIVREVENRKRLQKAAMDQAKVGEAPVVVIAVGVKEETKRVIEEVLREGAIRGAGDLEEIETVARQARKFLDEFPMDVWVNRHTMIAFTSLMLAAEAYGFSTAPMEGFDPDEVKREFGIPNEAEVVALLAIGRRKGPEKPYPGRFPLKRIVFQERFGTPWGSEPNKGHV